MKKLLLAAAVAAMGMSAAQAAPTVYGKLNVTLDQVDNNDFIKDNDVTEVNSNASRLGVKGEEKLTEKLGVVYQAEWAIATDGKDGGSDTDLSARNRYLGLKWADIGTLKAGSYDSYFKTAAGNAQDIFNDHTILDITNIMYGEERLKNVIGFETDKNLLAGVQFNIMAQQGEGDTTKDGSNEVRDGFGDAISTAISYENKDLGLALALAGDFGVQGKYNAIDSKNKYDSDAYRLTGSYNFKAAGLPGLTLGALWQQAELADRPSTLILSDLEEKAWGVTAAYKIANTPWTIKGQYHTAETSSNDLVNDLTVDQYGVGVDYNFNKQARLYGIVAQQKIDGFLLDPTTHDDTKTVVGLGMEYSF